MTGRLTTQYVAGSVVVVFAAGIWLTGGPLDVGWLKFYSIAVLVATGGLVLWEHVLWSLPLIQKIPRVPRVIKGTWRGELKSYWKDPGGQVLPVKPVYIAIRQTASSISVALYTDASSSVSSAASLSSADRIWTLDYMYLNQPELAVEDRSRMHHGSTSLRLASASGETVRLHGRYWTDRDSKGELDFTEREEALADDYTTASNLWP